MHSEAADLILRSDAIFTAAEMSYLADMSSLKMALSRR